uniref:Uncharacterized protein n=1 Tax=Guillardia theta TaxID=55529 RepID=A0A7S4KEP3_GUITH|mmetsp:Transcript_23660/g.77012  ORF Transcript_23660/g.77012 Transcript_23660/m.77012 type:complete len:100 (+) Transcript_23660:722-1021(+)
MPSGSSIRRIEVEGGWWWERNAVRSYASGLISGEELRHVLTRFGEPMDESEANDYIAEAEAKCPDVRANGEKTGMINYLAFIGVMLDLSEEEIASAGLQ